MKNLSSESTSTLAKNYLSKWDFMMSMSRMTVEEWKNLRSKLMSSWSDVNFIHVEDLMATTPSVELRGLNGKKSEDLDWTLTFVKIMNYYSLGFLLFSTLSEISNHYH